MKRLAYILVVVLLMVGVTGCGESATGIDTNVQITASFESDEDGVRLQGTTNLPDGAILVASIYPVGEAQLELVWEFGIDQPVEVQNGEYSHYFNVKEKNWTPGLEARIRVSFQPWRGLLPLQPDFVYEAFGENGEKMEGSQVYKVPGGPAVIKGAGLTLDFTWNPAGTEAQE